MVEMDGGGACKGVDVLEERYCRSVVRAWMAADGSGVGRRFSRGGGGTLPMACGPEVSVGWGKGGAGSEDLTVLPSGGVISGRRFAEDGGRAPGEGDRRVRVDAEKGAAGMEGGGSEG